MLLIATFSTGKIAKPNGAPGSDLHKLVYSMLMLIHQIRDGVFELLKVVFRPSLSAFHVVTRIVHSDASEAP